MRIENTLSRRATAILLGVAFACVAIYVGVQARGLTAREALDSGADSSARVVLDRGLLEHMRGAVRHVVPAAQVSRQAEALSSLCSKESERSKLEGALGHLQGLLAGLERKTPYALDMAQWQGEATALSCADALRAVRRLASRDLLERATWTEMVEGQGTGARVSGVRIALPEHLMAERNPWRDPAGCIFLEGAQGTGPARYLLKGSLHLCSAAIEEGAKARAELATEADQLRSVPATLIPALHTYVNPLQQVTDPARAPAGNAIRMRGHDLHIGYHALLTLDLEVQGIAQEVAACLAGTGPCSGLRSATDLEALRAGYEESAIVRRIGIVVVNTRGEILAMASAHSRCWERETRGLPVIDECPRAELSGDRDAWQAGTNHAEHESGLASMAKLALLAALVDSGRVGRTYLLHEVIRHAASSAPNAWFEGLATCAGSHARGPADCDMARRYIHVARGLGWQMGGADLLFGRPMSPGDTLPWGSRPAPIVRALMRQENGVLLPMEPERDSAMIAPYRVFASARQMVQTRRLSPSRLAAWVGAQGLDYGGYVKTRDLGLNAIGHGDSRASPVGVAWTMANFAAMAAGQAGIRYPHLVRRVLDAQGRAVDLQALGVESGVLEPVLTPTKARQLLEVLGYVASSRHGGTAAQAYTEVFGVACTGACVVGKTGTLANEPVKGFALLSALRGEPVGIAVTVERGLLKGTRDGANRAALGAFVLTRTLREVLQQSL